jgi:hypothetical protein
MRGIMLYYMSIIITSTRGMAELKIRVSGRELKQS